MTAYYKNIDKGYPGTPSRANLGGFMVETKIAGTTPLAYGMVVQLDPTGAVVPFGDASVGASTRTGVLVRPFPKQGQATIAGTADLTYEGEPVSVMFKGYITANFDSTGGPATVGGAVFAQDYDPDTPATAQVSAATGTTTTGIIFTEAMTASGMIEIAVNNA